MRINQILKQIQAKAKAEAVIDSCENCFHYKTAEKYIDRYHIQFGDLVGKVQLSNQLQEVKLRN